MAASKQIRGIILNEKEKKVFDAFPRTKEDGDFKYVELSYLAGEAFGSAKKGTSPKSKGNSWVRNSLRKLVNLKVVKMKGKRTGLYALTGKDLPEPPPEMLAKEAEKAEKSNVPKKKAAKKKAAPKAKAKGKTKSKAKKKADGDDASAEPSDEDASAEPGVSDLRETDDDDDDDDDDEDEEASAMTASGESE